MNTSANSPVLFDLRQTLEKNRLRGLWRMLAGYRLAYAGATFTLAISALSKTATLFLLRYFADVIGGDAQPLAA